MSHNYPAPRMRSEGVNLGKGWSRGRPGDKASLNVHVRVGQEEGLGTRLALMSLLNTDCVSKAADS